MILDIRPRNGVLKEPFTEVKVAYPEGVLEGSSARVGWGEQNVIKSEVADGGVCLRVVDGAKSSGDVVSDTNGIERSKPLSFRGFYVAAE